jgi:hypothetical protein
MSADRVVTGEIRALSDRDGKLKIFYLLPNKEPAMANPQSDLPHFFQKRALTACFV